MSSAKWSWFYTTILEYIKWFLFEKIRFFFWSRNLYLPFLSFILFGLRIYYVMSTDFKLCIKCDKLVNILDHHDDCCRHRVCNSEFPCEICKFWTSEKRQLVERMIDKARLAVTKKQSRSTDVETCPLRPPTGTRQFVASSLLSRADNQNNQSLLTGTVTIHSPLVGTGTFQSNSPVGIASVHDNHASNIDLNAQARTEMSSNPFMWMINMPNQQDFWKDFMDKRVQEALNPTLLRSAATSATFISNTTTSVSTSVNLLKCQT